MIWMRRTLARDYTLSGVRARRRATRSSCSTTRRTATRTSSTNPSSSTSLARPTTTTASARPDRTSASARTSHDARSPSCSASCSRARRAMHSTGAPVAAGVELHQRDQAPALRVLGLVVRLRLVEDAQRPRPPHRARARRSARWRRPSPRRPVDASHRRVARRARAPRCNRRTRASPRSTNASSSFVADGQLALGHRRPADIVANPFITSGINPRRSIAG